MCYVLFIQYIFHCAQLGSSKGSVCVFLDFWRPSPLPSVLDCSSLCSLLYIRLCQWKLLHRWQVKAIYCHIIWKIHT